eukprot:Gregarina_sp_Pseudo_9__2343@NODE_2655_length_922_cov_9_969422_g2435_i0_p1_GENE_NODE_2655_length_922_cov_9_969422_g2435_i0NODE_2655_length_922_cov_9_969422_g2435_i0_p1_ORF_typecomplete_len189_score16_05YfkB/PF08756_10/0_0085_NODE_2655_length_922_cov_9_969422_g2435_i0170736
MLMTRLCVRPRDTNSRYGSSLRFKMKISVVLFSCALQALAAETGCAAIKDAYKVPATGNGYLPPREGIVVVNANDEGVRLTWKSESESDMVCFCPKAQCLGGNTLVDGCSCTSSFGDDPFLAWAHEAMRTLRYVDTSKSGNPELYTLLGVINLSPVVLAAEQSCDWHGAYKVESDSLPGWTGLTLVGP